LADDESGVVLDPTIDQIMNLEDALHKKKPWDLNILYGFFALVLI
jgi:hypothetical protein